LERKQREERLFTRGSLSTFPSRASRHGNVALALCGLGHYGCAQLIPTVNEIWFVWNLNWSWQAFISEQNGAYRKTGTQQWGHDPYWIGRNRAPAPSMSLVQRVNPSQATMREIGLLVISIYLPQDVHIYRELYGHDRVRGSATTRPHREEETFIDESNSWLGTRLRSGGGGGELRAGRAVTHGGGGCRLVLAVTIVARG
jgi:hypothetical protein